MEFQYIKPDLFNGDGLRTEITAALRLPEASVVLTWQDKDLKVIIDSDIPVDSEKTIENLVSAHTGELTPVQVAEAQAESAAQQAKTSFDNLVEKCLEVQTGKAIFTDAERDELLAGIVLYITRRVK